MKRAADGSTGEPAKKAKGESNLSRFLVSNQVAGVVIGKAGATVKRIRSESGVVVSIKSDPAVTTDRVLAVMGTFDNISTALKLILEHLVQVEQPQAEMAMLIHSAYTGAIIGKAGATIKQLMVDTGATLRLSNDPLPGSSEKTCTIGGSIDQILAAYLSLAQNMHANPPRSTGNEVQYLSGAATGGAGGAAATNAYAQQYAAAAQGYYGMAAGAGGGNIAQNPYAQAAASYGAYGVPAGMEMYYQQQQQQTGGAAPPFAAPVIGAVGGAVETTEVPIADNMAGAVIGKGGNMIKNINQRSGCNVSIGDPVDGQRMVSIRGPWEGIEVALEAVRKVIEPEPFEGAQTEAAVPVPAPSAGLVIGKAGSVIRNIKIKSGVSTLSLADATEANPEERLLTMRGGPLAVTVATIMVMHKLSEPNSQPSAASMAGASMEQLYVPTNCAGQVIGKGGQAIAEIKMRSGCAISIADPAPEQPDQRVATVRGTPQGIQIAVALLQEKITLGRMALGVA